MKNYTIFCLLLVALVFNLSSCIDGDIEEAPRPKPKKEILSGKTWEIQRIKGDGIDITNDPDWGYYKNLRLTFSADGNYSRITQDGSENGAWELIDRDTRIVLDPNTNLEEIWSIIELKENSFKAKTLYVVEDKKIVTEFEMVDVRD